MVRYGKGWRGVVRCGTDVWYEVVQRCTRCVRGVYDVVRCSTKVWYEVWRGMVRCGMEVWMVRCGTIMVRCGKAW